MGGLVKPTSARSFCPWPPKPTRIIHCNITIHRHHQIILIPVTHLSTCIQPPESRFRAARFETSPNPITLALVHSSTTRAVYDTFHLQQGVWLRKACADGLIVIRLAVTLRYVTKALTCESRWAAPFMIDPS
jgi:hypothetical protein